MWDITAGEEEPQRERRRERERGDGGEGRWGTARCPVRPTGTEGCTKFSRVCRRAPTSVLFIPFLLFLLLLVRWRSTSVPNQSFDICSTNSSHDVNGGYLCTSAAALYQGYCTGTNIFGQTRPLSRENFLEKRFYLTREQKLIGQVRALFTGSSGSLKLSFTILKMTFFIHL